VKLFDRNHYCLYLSKRCNYQCSYCINYAGRGSPQSEDERNIDRVIEVFDSVEPGCITVSGGEPTIWKSMPDIIERLPQHYWIFLSNCSYIPDWIHQDSVKLVIAAWHPEQAIDIEAFADRVSRLKRAVAKVIVFPDKEQEAVGYHETLHDLGIVSHLVSCEYPHVFSQDMLDYIVAYPTSLMYNSRFFINGATTERLCDAGTSSMFQINPNGKIMRCSQSTVVSDIFNPEWYEESMSCKMHCYCEWHHWAGTAMANDNPTWERFVDTGEWVAPTKDELVLFLERNRWI